MRSIIFCEGPDDLWFSACYLHKAAEWDDCKSIRRHWPLYQVKPLNSRQQVNYYSKGVDNVAIWSVAGKDSFDYAIKVAVDKFIASYPSSPVDSLVILRDRDTDSEEAILSHFSNIFDNKVVLSNQRTAIYSSNIDGIDINTKITPVIIPFDDCGAIESLLMASIHDANSEGEIIADEACKYIDLLVDNPDIGQIYLRHEREIIKAKFAATIAATNPGHSTGLFQDLVLSCPWEASEYVKSHFDIIVNAVTSA